MPKQTPALMMLARPSNFQVWEKWKIEVRGRHHLPFPKYLLRAIQKVKATSSSDKENEVVASSLVKSWDKLHPNFPWSAF